MHKTKNETVIQQYCTIQKRKINLNIGGKCIPYIIAHCSWCMCRGVLSVWSRVLAYQIISDQRAKVFNLLSTWVRDLLSMTNCINGSSHQHTLLLRLDTRTSSVKKDRSIRYRLKVDAVPLGMKKYLYIQYQQSLVLEVRASRQWIIKHIAITTGLKPSPTVQKL